MELLLPDGSPQNARLCRICEKSWIFIDYWTLFDGRCLDCRIAAGEQPLPEDDDVYF